MTGAGRYDFTQQKSKGHVLDAIKGYFTKTLENLTPEQVRWLSLALLTMGFGFFWRIAQGRWPTTGLAAAGLLLFTATAFSYVNFIQKTPRFRTLLVPSIPIFVGGFMNYLVMAANHGYMPCPLETGINGLYCPMVGASLPWLSDWIFAFISPGDVLMVIGFVGIMVTLLRHHKLQSVEQQA